MIHGPGAEKTPLRSRASKEETLLRYCLTMLLLGARTLASSPHVNKLLIFPRVASFKWRSLILLSAPNFPRGSCTLKTNRKIRNPNGSLVCFSCCHKTGVDTPQEESKQNCQEENERHLVIAPGAGHHLFEESK